MVNAQQLQGQWNRIKGEVKKKWGQLTEDDLAIAGGNVDQLIGRIQQRTGESREAIENYLNDLTSQASATVGQMAESAREYAQQAASRIRDNYDQVAERARYGYDHAQEMVRERPGQSVAAAFAAGLFVGLIVGISLSSSR